DLRQPLKGQHEVKSKEMLIWCKRRKVPGVYALNRFLSRSAERALPFFETLKNITNENKDDYLWTEETERAFQKIKKIIIKLLTLTTLVSEEALYVYLVSSQDTVSGVLLAERKGKQTPIRYVSRTLHEAERIYALLEKLALCLLHLSWRLRRCFEAYMIKLITDQPIKQILNKLEVLADFLNEIPIGTKHLEICSLTGEEAKMELWTLCTDGASSLKGVASLAGLRIERKMKVHALKVKVDSKLVACQLNDEFVASSEVMTKYLTKVKEHVALFEKISIENIPRYQNQKTDVLSKLASVAFNHLTKEVLVEVLNAKSVDVQEVNTIVKGEEDNWINLIIKCLEEGVRLKNENEARTLRMKISQYVIEEGVLFKKSYLAPMLRCVKPLQANYIIRETRLTSIMSPWPFYQCGLDILGTLPEGPNKLKFIIVAIDYFTKFKLQIVIVIDNRTQLVNDLFKSLCGKFKIKQMKTTVSHPQANGLVERANKSLMHGLKKRLGRESLTYGSEAVIPAEIGMLTYQPIQFNEALNEEEMPLKLDLIQERRETVAIREAKYKKKVEQYYNKRVRHLLFKVRDFIYRGNKASRL
nr:hypothetical protein [Tanacetum cinerariifolium]